MFIQIIISLIAGISAGIFTGLIPGVHINLISIILVNISVLLLPFISPIAIGAFIIGMSVVHSFLNSIPSIYLGAPDEAQALSVLPGHRLLLQGQGHTAVMLTVIGSFFALIACIIFSPIFLVAVKTIYPIIRDYIGYILIMIMIYMIFKDNKRFLNLAVFLMCGTLGIIVLNMPNAKDVLFPLLSGLFGFSILIMSLMQKSTIPKQKQSKNIDIDAKTTAKAIAGATSTGFMASFLPGFSSSQAAIIASQFLKNIGDNGFLVLVGGINTVNFTLSLVTLYALSKARNGAVIALREIVGEISIQMLAIYFFCALIAGSAAVLLAMKISKIFAKLIVKVKYNVLIIGIMVFVTLLVAYFSGVMGLTILIVATYVGLFASSVGVGKNHCMGCLILPVILYFIL